MMSPILALAATGWGGLPGPATACLCESRGDLGEVGEVAAGDQAKLLCSREGDMTRCSCCGTCMSSRGDNGGAFQLGKLGRPPTSTDVNAPAAWRLASKSGGEVVLRGDLACKPKDLGLRMEPGLPSLGDATCARGTFSFIGAMALRSAPTPPAKLAASC
mmetsp:Transcript_46890/g.121408  ORF Transcript_46890/g.121408 Transcript_46890/m.121408 type:complete len:160 (-) Transcript_46890:11-490(-)